MNMGYKKALKIGMTRAFAILSLINRNIFKYFVDKIISMDARTGIVPAATTSLKRSLSFFLVVVPVVAILVGMVYRYARLEVSLENNTEQINEVQTEVKEGRREMRSDLKDLNKQMREIEQRLTKFETRMDSNTGKM